MEDLISAPIDAIVKAQFLAAKSTFDFISEVGFEQQENKLKMIEFNYTHPLPDPQNPGQVIDTPTVLKIPLLTMLQIPNLSISESTIDFNLKVLGFSQDVKKKPVRFPLKIHTTYAPKNMTTANSAEQQHTISISIKLQKTDLAEGGQKMLSLIQESMTARPSK